MEVLGWDLEISIRESLFDQTFPDAFPQPHGFHEVWGRKDATSHVF